MADDISYFDEISQLAQFLGVESKQKESLDWFRDNMQYIYGRGEISKTDLIRQEYNKIKENGLPGKMYMFRYYPKGVDSLPYYDAFPLVVSLEFKRSHMLGLNLHYLPPKYRNILFKNLLSFNSDKTLSDQARFRATYTTLKSLSRLRYFKPCIKKYLPAQIRSAAIIIPPKYWMMAVNLPIDSFKKENRHKVWRDSINKIR